MPDGGNPFITISETNQPLCLAGVEYTVLLSVGREYRLTVFAHRVKDTDELSTCEDSSIAIKKRKIGACKGLMQGIPAMGRCSCPGLESLFFFYQNLSTRRLGRS